MITPWGKSSKQLNCSSMLFVGGFV